MATTFWLLMGYNFGCMIASDTRFDSRGGFSWSSYPMKTADFDVLRDVAIVTIFGFLCMGCTCPSVLVLQCFDAVGWAAGRASSL